MGVAELLHESVTGFRVLSKAEAFLFDTGGEAEVGKGWSDDVEGWCVVITRSKEGKKLGDF